MFLYGTFIAFDSLFGIFWLGSVRGKSATKFFIESLDVQYDALRRIFAGRSSLWFIQFWLFRDYASLTFSTLRAKWPAKRVIFQRIQKLI